MLGAGCTGAALALQRMMQEDGTPGTIRVYGCAAEETEGAKLYMARDGLFDDLDAALAWHPAPVAGAGLVSTSSNAAVKVTFTGRTAHAGNTPWEGRSALKAAELFGAGIQYMREHVRPTVRIHYVYESAGVAPNVVPDHAAIWIVFRGIDSEEVRPLVDWGRQIAEGAALMTQTEANYLVYKGMYELQPNEPLARALYAHMQARPPVWSEDEQAFARACQTEMGLPPAGMATSVLPFLPEMPAGASSDLGDVSKITPLGVFGWPTAGIGTGLHTWAITACAGMSIGDRASLDTARILAGIGHDLMTDPALRAAARADFDTRRAAGPSPRSSRPNRRPPSASPTGCARRARTRSPRRWTTQPSENTNGARTGRRSRHVVGCQSPAATASQFTSFSRKLVRYAGRLLRKSM